MKWFSYFKDYQQKEVDFVVKEGWKVAGEVGPPQKLIRACPNWKEGTYQAFLYKHRKGNPGGNSELFEKVGKGKFQLLKPLKYEF